MSLGKGERLARTSPWDPGLALRHLVWFTPLLSGQEEEMYNPLSLPFAEVSGAPGHFNFVPSALWFISA